MKFIALIIFFIGSFIAFGQNRTNTSASYPVLGKGLHSYPLPFEHIQQIFNQNGEISDTLFGYVNRVYSPNKEYFYSREFDDSLVLSIVAVYKKNGELIAKVPTNNWLFGVYDIWLNTHLVLNFSYRKYFYDTVGTFISIIDLENGQLNHFAAKNLHIIGKIGNRAFFQPWHQVNSVEGLGIIGMTDFVSLGIDGLKLEKIPYYENYNLKASSTTDTIYHIELYNDYTYLSRQISKSNNQIISKIEIWHKGKQLEHRPLFQQLKMSDTTIDWVEFFIGKRKSSALLRLKQNKVDTLVDLMKHTPLFDDDCRIVDFEVGEKFILLNIAKAINSECELYLYDRKNNSFLKAPEIVVKDEM
jgi:hypothetical protein